MKLKKQISTKIGTGYALGAGLTWGLDTVLIGLIFTMAPFIDNEQAIILAPFVSTFMHDSFSAIWISIYHLIKGEFGQVLKSFKTKSGLFIMLGALLGGPIGMTCYLLSVKYIGPAYAASITSIFPAVGAVFAFLFLKEKLNKRICIGIFLSILGVIIIGYTPTDPSLRKNFLLGILAALGTVFGWGLESVICAKGMKEDVTAEHALNIRQVTSCIFYGIVIIPLIGGYPLVVRTFNNSSLYLLIITALVGTASYVFYYIAINTIGAAKSTALNITYAVWATLLQVIFFKTMLTAQLLLGSLIIITGAVLVSGDPKEMFGINKKAA